MKVRLRALVISASCVLAFASHASTMLEIRSGLLALHQLQDEIARGDTEGVAFQKAILDRITAEVEKMASSGADEHEFQISLIELALSGGDRDRLAKLLRQKAGHGEVATLISGVEAYLTGDMVKAAELLGQDNIQSLGLTRAGHFVELARGTALLGSDIDKSRKSFETAILQAPGTLVEEVALRRLLDISRKQKDSALFVRCAQLYLRRYGRSPFAAEFMTGFSSGAGLVSDPAMIENLSNLTFLLPDQTRNVLIRELVRNLVVEGKVGPAKAYLERLAKTKEGEDLSKDGELRLLAMLVAPDKLSAGVLAEPGLAQGIDPVNPEMAELQDIARHVAWNMFKPLAADMKATDEDGAAQDTAAEFAKADPVLVRAQAALGRLGETAKAAP